MTSSLHIKYVGHATLLVEMNGVRVLTDPVLRDRIGHIRRQSNPVNTNGLRDIDAVLISHMHYDHLDLPSLRQLGQNARLIVPYGSGGILYRNGLRHIEEVRAGDTVALGDVTITATHADHSGDRHPFGPRADCLGYMIEGESSVYFAGDTDLFPEMGAFRNPLDVALLPVWGWGPTLGEGHLCPRRAAESLQMLRPRRAVPIHWGTFAPLGMGWMRPRFLTDPPYDFALHANDLAPDVDVHVVHPGGSLNLRH